MRKKSFAFLILFLCFLGNKAQSQTTEYPYNFNYNGNPLVRNHGAADPDAHVWDDTIWVYCSQDHEVIDGDTYKTMDGYHVFSSADMVNWTDHGEILHSRDVSWGIDGYMWAPCAARKKDINNEYKYYLYYPHKDKTGNWRIGVATSDVPQGPFADIGNYIEGTSGIDPSVLVDDDDKAYMYFDHNKIARLKDNMIEFTEEPRRIIYGSSEIMNNPDLNASEGPFIHKKDSIYYFSYSNLGKGYAAYYAMGDNPYGPFEWKGPIAEWPRGAQDHHSIIDFKGQSYYFYHISLSNIPVNKEGQGRIACFDRLYYNQDGTIQIVVHTLGPKKVISTNTPHGIIFLDPPGGAYDEGTEVTLTVAGDLGYAFDSWSGDLSGSNNPTTIVMDADKSVSASFVTTPTYTLTASSTNGTVILDPPVGVYNSGTVVTLTPDDDFGYDFSEWSGDLTGKENPGTITMDSDKNITANCVSVPVYTLKTNSINGIISLSPTGGIYEEGTIVTLKALRDFGFGFSSWSGDLNGSENPATLIMDANKDITANFTYVGGGTVVFATNCGGEVFKSADGVNFSKDKDYSGGGTFASNKDISGTTDDVLYHTERFGNNFSYNIDLQNGEYEVTIMFAEIFFNTSGQRIFNVSMEGTEVSGNLDIVSKAGAASAYEETHTVTVNDGKLNISFNAVKDNAKVSAIKVIRPDTDAKYTLQPYVMNGSIILSPPGGEYIKGTSVNLTAIPDDGFYFKEWSGDLSGPENPSSIIMDANKNVTAEIRDTNSYSLTLNAINGSVQAIPGSDVYLPGAAVILVAAPDEGYNFTEWSGDLSGAENPTSIIMDTNKNITARFNELTSIDYILNKVPSKNMLMQNYPNPFTKETTISYQLEKTSQVKLTIYNAFGQEVAILVNEQQPAGYHTADWDATDNTGNKLTPGTYMYQMQTNNQPVQTRHLILL